MRVLSLFDGICCGHLALERAGTDDLLRNDIINSYLDMGINLGE